MTATKTIVKDRRCDLLPELRPGVVFAERFLLRDELGQGGVAVVWRVWDRIRFREVALKIMEPDPNHVVVAIDRFGREVKLAARVRHPLVVRPLDAGTWRGALWISMPVVLGEPLRRRIRRELPSIDEGIELAIRMCSALEAVHRTGSLHRDIKTGNFMVTADDDLRLIDFGLARSMEHAARGTADENLEGSPLYTPPERFRGRAEDIRSEVYALGATLYELFTGRLPVRGHDLAVICANVLTASPSPLTEHDATIPDELNRLVLRMLAREPDARPDHVADVRAVLEGIQADRSGELRVA